MKNKLFIWHDVINIFLTPHPSNTNTPCTVADLVEILIEIKGGYVIGIVPCQRKFGSTLTTDTGAELLKTGIKIIEVRKHLISRRKNKDPIVLADLSELIPSAESKRRLLKFIISYSIHPLDEDDQKLKRSLERNREDQLRPIKCKSNSFCLYRSPVNTRKFDEEPENVQVEMADLAGR